MTGEPTTGAPATGAPATVGAADAALGAADPALVAADAAVVAALRAGDEAAFRDLVTRHHASLVRVARSVVGSHAVAEEVAQDTWIAVIKGLDGFGFRASLRSWIFGILMNQARSRRTRESRTVAVPFLGTAEPSGENSTPSVAADRFVADGSRWAGHWCAPPMPWSNVPAERLTGAETIAVARAAIDELPQLQRAVVTLRDVECWSSEEVTELLGITANNQRVALHRGRSRVRARLEQHLSGDE